MRSVIDKNKTDDQDQVIDKDSSAQAIKPYMPYLFVFYLFSGEDNKEQTQRHQQSGAHKKKMLAHHSIHPADQCYWDMCDDQPPTEISKPVGK